MTTPDRHAEPRSASPTRRCATAATPCATSSPRRRFAASSPPSTPAASRSSRSRTATGSAAPASTTASPAPTSSSSSQRRRRGEAAPRSLYSCCRASGRSTTCSTRTRAAPRSRGSPRTAPRPTCRSSTSARRGSSGMETVGFLMLAHRIEPAELAKQARIMVDAGAQCVYVVDSAGALMLADAQERVKALHDEIGAQAAGRLPRPPEPLAGRGELRARRPDRRPADRRRAVRPRRGRRQRTRPRCSPRPSSAWASAPTST